MGEGILRTVTSDGTFSESGTIRQKTWSGKFSELWSDVAVATLCRMVQLPKDFGFRRGRYGLAIDKRVILKTQTQKYWTTITSCQVSTLPRNSTKFISSGWVTRSVFNALLDFLNLFIDTSNCRY
jgi:hypothetical protein